MTDTRVEASDPPTQEAVLIASWGARHGTWIEDCGDGEALVSMWVEGERKTVALIAYGPSDDDRTKIEWNRNGTLALEQYKRDAWDTQFYKEIGFWKKRKATS